MSEPFAMTVEDVFDVEGRGTVLTGTVESGSVHVGDVVLLDGVELVVTGLERFTKPFESASAGEAIGVIVRGVAKPDVQTGARLTAHT